MAGFVEDFAPTVRSAPKVPQRLLEVDSFGSNPGNLRMYLAVPDHHLRTRPLVVVLHGCRQTAAGYDAASGWSTLAKRHDFLVLYPEQREANNRQRCFAWFEAEDTQRGLGEVASMRQMIATATASYGADPKQTFVCGLSAGGAMAGAMLAAYPETFRGGAIIAGLPYGTAANLSDAYDSMSTGKIKEARAWGDLVRGASSHQGPWPTVSIWHGVADNVVKPINAGELVKQWTNVHGLGAEVPTEDHIGKVIRRAWYDAKNRPCVTEYSVPGIAHGVPVDDIDPPAPFFLPAGISSTWHIAHDWGLTGHGKLRVVKTLLGLGTELADAKGPFGATAAIDDPSSRRHE